MFSAEEITRFKKTKTPFYYYNLELLKATLDEVKKASSQYDYHVHYAFKANTNNQILLLSFIRQIDKLIVMDLHVHCVLYG